MSGSSPRALKLLGFALLLFIGEYCGLRAFASDFGFPIVTPYATSSDGREAGFFSSAQTSSGTMLFGGRALTSFDGDHWRNYPVEGMYAIRSLNFGRDGHLWTAATGNFGWFEQVPPFDWKYRSLLAFLPDEDRAVGTVWRVFPGRNDAIFVTTNRILRWDGKALRTEARDDENRLLGTRVNGTVYVHHLPQGLLAVRPKGTELIIPREALSGASIYWLDARKDDLLLGTSKGMSLYRDQKVIPFAAEVSAIVARETLVCGAQLPDGRYAFGTLAGSIVVMQANGELDQILGKKDGLPSWITSLFIDREGLLWATTSGGIFKIDLNPDTRIFDERSGLPSATDLSIVGIGGRIIVGSENGVRELSADGHTFVPLDDPLNRVRHVRAYPNELLIAGYRSAKRIREGRVETFMDGRGDVFAFIRSRNSPEQYFFSNTQKIWAIGSDNTPREIVASLPDYPRSIGEDNDGNLWLGTVAQGVWCATPQAGSATTAWRVDGSPRLPLLKGHTLVRAAADGAIFAFSDDSGWWKPVGAAQFRPIRNYPPRRLVAASDFSADGTGWIVHSESAAQAACAARISTSGQDAFWEPHSIPGLPQIGSPRGIFVETTDTAAVNLWIGATKAVLRHVVRTGPLAPRPRTPVLYGFSRSEESTARQAITRALPYSTSSVEFEFAAPEFLRRASLRLQTRIDGIDSEWQAAEPDSRRTLTAVRDGNFAFRVRTVAETGVASEETVFKFQILPPWWRSQLALACEGAAAMLALWGAYGWRVRSLRRRNEALEQKVRQRTQELEEASAAKTQFVANMSHDIRNPLNGIVGLTLALENSKLDRRQREIVATLRECSTYLSSLVDDVLDFASIEAGRVELRPGPFVPQELLRSIVNTLKADADTRGAVLLVEADPHLPPHILGDAGRIQQILVNFVSNALKYAGGQIRLSVSTPADTFGEIEFAVTDEGPGISAEEQRTLFTKFTRVKRTQGHDIPGTGLGLAACRLLADLMGGSVGVESRTGEGARFFLRLPLEAATAPSEFPAANVPNTTVLLVEDTDYNAWAAEAVLAKLGLACERARTGAEALQMFAAKRFNVVLLDRNLPDMDGTEVARQMRAAEAEGPQAVLLAVTAYCTAEDRALCLEAGMDAFVGKPLTPEKLRRILVEAGRKLLTAPSFHVSSDSAAPMPAHEIDLKLLRYLSDGTPEGFETQVQRFLAALSEADLHLDGALGAADYAGLAQGAHGLHGTGKMIGATTLMDACVRLEAAAGAADRDACGQALRRVRDEVRAVTAAMQRHRSAPQST